MSLFTLVPRFLTMHYTKQLENLSVLVQFPQNNATRATVTFQNTSNSIQRLNLPVNGDCQLFVGSLQLFGYVILNYNFGLDDFSSISMSDKAPRNSSWWLNREYLLNLCDTENDVYHRNEMLSTVPFISDNANHQMVIGGKVGGVNDLVVEESAKIQIDLNQRYLLNDLVYNFNTYKPSTNSEEDGKLYLKELTDSIVPFYSTSQELLFTDLLIPPMGSKSIEVSFPLPDLPPSYNTNLTGLSAEQGLVSIKYLMIVGFQKLESLKLNPVSIYFPLHIKSPRFGHDERWLQPDYLQQITIDKSWKLSLTEDNKSTTPIKQDDSSTDAKSFLEDLDKLIDSDLHNIPKMSSTERKKSVQSLYEENVEGMVPQLPSRLKNQYNFLVNNKQLCLITLSKPYYHVGEDILFNIELDNSNPRASKIVGMSGHIEAHELFHSATPYTNVYPVTPQIKINSFASAMINSFKEEAPLSEPAIMSGCLNIPSHVCQQFQSSTFMDLKYYIVFKFNLTKFDKKLEQEVADGEENSDLIQKTDELHSQIEPYKYNVYGNEFTFRLPVVILA